MTEQNKTGGDASQGGTPWWVNQASGIEAPRGPMPAQQGTATGTPKGPAVETPPKEEAPKQETPKQEPQEPPQQEMQEAQAETPAAEAPAAEPAQPKAEEPVATPQAPVAETPAEPQEPVAETPAEPKEPAAAKPAQPVESPQDQGDQALVSLEGPIAEIKEAVAELSELASPSEGSDRAPTLGGSASALPIPSILELLSANRKSGTLSVTSGGERFTLEILEGDVVHASSDRSTREQLLGSILVARDKIDAEQLEDFYKRYTQSSEGEDAEHETLVSREDLMSALEEQVQELFNRLYSAVEGTFSFFEGESSNVEQRIRMNVTKLLLESARTKDEADRKPGAHQPDGTEPS